MIRLVYGIAKRCAFEVNRCDMPTVAEQLRTAREARKLTIYQIAEITKIRTDHIRALEDGNFDVFVATVYIRGFVRAYATLLKLDVPQVMLALESELALTEKFSEPPPLSKQRRGVLDFLMLLLSRMDWRKAGLVLGAVAAAGLIVGIYAMWRHHQKRNPLADLPPGVYQPGANDSGETLPLTNARLRR
jgi:cytoskeletal protein RodZ